MATALVSLGSNLGDCATILASAVDELAQTPGVVIRRVSRWRETIAVGGPSGQAAFLNGAALLETSLDPLALLRELQRIEHDAGRRRVVRWEARPLDLDLLLYKELRLDSPDLILPHPRMAFRRFVLEPAAEIAGDLVHAPSQRTLAGLLARLNAPQRYFAIAGPRGSGRKRLAEQVRLARPHVELIPRPAVFDSPGAVPAATMSAASVIAKELAEGDRARVVVTPFWLEQTALELRLATRRAPTDSAIVPSAECDAGAGPHFSSVSPLLVVLLEEPTPSSQPTLGSHQAAAVTFSERGATSTLLALAERPGFGPVLPIAAREGIDRALVELLAAIDASS